MSMEIKVPHLGDGVESGDILTILVREGEIIEKNQGLVELETDKATVEVPSTHAGRVAKVLVEVGQTVPVGAALIALEPAAGSAAAPDKPAPPAEKPATKAAKPAPKPEPAAAKPAAPAAKPAAPAAKPAAPAAKPAAPAAKPAAPAAKPAAPAAKPAARPAALPTVPAPELPEPAEAEEDLDAEAPEDTAPAADDAQIAAGPAIRRFAREVGVDLRRVKGTGPGGRITREDVLEVVRQASQAAAAGAVQAAAASGPGTPSSDSWGPIRIDRMSKIRKTIALQMHRSWETCPRVTNFDDADVTELERIRQSSKNDYAARGIRLSALPFVIKSIAMALKNHPVLNASVDVDNGLIVYKDYVNIGVAVDTDRGLVVPVLRSADRMSFPEIARALAQIAENARTNNFSVDDLRGSTFSISNLGAIGGTYATPIINYPEVAILLVGRTRKLPVVLENDQIVPRLMMPLSLSYDHRLVDGAAASRFLNEVIGYLESPSRLLLAP